MSSSQEGLSGYQIGARNRNPYPCDHCIRDRRKCEVQTGVPCIRCTEKGRSCTVHGYTKEYYHNALVQENFNRHPFLFPRTEGDGFLALMNSNGHLCLQHVTLHYVKIGPPIVVNPQVLQWINGNQTSMVDNMFNQLYNNNNNF
ncbi:hypothetical protein SCHPADRAFT_483299 [Schizopora paradoxa]|uniref:Zn(2)-C6 fungal-type domain-containing protein n=1 Tax=Schizopora paradoxa TaxID=27342 RepID=A0A0H2S2B3_9AGAM|nr:hypothetical protein SCHPADRAFT_483299 [Schizopora paradoxa]